jgi:hypothetical protein
MSRRTLTTAVALATLSGGAFCHANLITDNTFNLTDWSLSEATYGGSGSWARASVDGLPGYEGNARVIELNVAGSGSGINGISIFSLEAWDGTAPLEQLTMSIRARALYSGQKLGFAIEQGGKYWIAGLFSNTSDWDLYTMNLTAADFTRPFGVDPSSQPAMPDFSEGAAPIRFGFHATTISLPGWGEQYNIGRYSAFSVSFVPAPPAAAIIALGAICSRRRRSA